jgi:hypothetical protein
MTTLPKGLQRTIHVDSTIFTAPATINTGFRHAKSSFSFGDIIHHVRFVYKKAIEELM